MKTFFIHELSFKAKTLVVMIGGSSGPSHNFVFANTAAFFAFEESDLYEKLGEMKCSTMIQTDSPDCGLFKIEHNPLLGTLLGPFRDANLLQSYLVATPQECVEVAAFSDPVVNPI